MEYVLNSLEGTMSPLKGTAEWLYQNDASLAITSYQTGGLILVGLNKDGSLSVNEGNFDQTTGVHFDGKSLYVASFRQIWRLENILEKGEFYKDNNDQLFVPRHAQTVGDVDPHEIGLDKSKNVVFVNTAFSCIARTDTIQSFQPIWKPSFITELKPEHRCHLNGMAMDNAEPILATSISFANEPDGWRGRRQNTGVLMSVPSGDILQDQISMPHSPRLHNGNIWLVESGRGYLQKVNARDNTREDVAFCPGFLRGMSMYGKFAVAATSLGRYDGFEGLKIQDELDKTGEKPFCGIHIIDIYSGQLVGGLKFGGKLREIFDVTVLPKIKCPNIVNVTNDEVLLTLGRPLAVL